MQISSLNPGDDSRFDELLHFPLNRRGIHAGNSGEFSQMYRAIGLRKQNSQNALLGARKNGVGETQEDVAL